MKKFFLISFFLFLCAAIIWGGFSHIIVYEHLYANNWTHYLALVLSVILLYLLYKPNSPLQEKLKEKNKNIFLSTIGFLFAIFLLTKLFFERGIPILIHSFTSEPATMQVRVKDRISQKHCRKGVSLQSYNRLGNGKVCGLHDKFLSFAKYGTPLTLIGKKSFFGFTVESYRYQEPLQNTFMQKNATKISSDFSRLHYDQDNTAIIESEAKITNLVLQGHSQTLIRNNAQVTTLTLTDQAALHINDNPIITNLIASKNGYIQAQGGNISFIYLLGQNSLHLSKLNINAGGYTSPTLNFSGGAVFFTKEAQISLTVQDYTFRDGVIQGHWSDGIPFGFTLVTTDFIFDASNDTQPLEGINLMASFLRLPLYKPNALPKNIHIQILAP